MSIACTVAQPSSESRSLVAGTPTVQTSTNVNVGLSPGVMEAERAIADAKIRLESELANEKHRLQFRYDGMAEQTTVGQSKAVEAQKARLGQESRILSPSLVAAESRIAESEHLLQAGWSHFTHEPDQLKAQMMGSEAKLKEAEVSAEVAASRVQYSSDDARRQAECFVQNTSDAYDAKISSEYHAATMYKQRLHDECNDAVAVAVANALAQHNTANDPHEREKQYKNAIIRLNPLVASTNADEKPLNSDVATMKSEFMHMHAAPKGSRSTQGARACYAKGR